MIQEEFERCFSSNEACQRYLYSLRWPEGFVCPKCGGKRKTDLPSGLYLCLDCNRKTSITQGTIFQDTHLPLTKWFQIMWHVCMSDGISALKLKRDLKLGSYRTAWLCLHKLRKVMILPSRDRFADDFEFDVACMEIPKHDERGKRTTEKILVSIAVNRKYTVPRIRVTCIPSLSHRDLLKSIYSIAHKDAAIYIDSFNFFSLFPGQGRFFREARKTKTLEGRKSPMCYCIEKNMKQWIHKVRGPISREHLQDYLNEFSFRCNYKKSGRGLLFCHLAERAMLSEEVTYSDIIRHR